MIRRSFRLPQKCPTETTLPRKAEALPKHVKVGRTEPLSAQKKDTNHCRIPFFLDGGNLGLFLFERRIINLNCLCNHDERLTTTAPLGPQGETATWHMRIYFPFSPVKCYLDRVQSVTRAPVPTSDYKMLCSPPLHSLRWDFLFFFFLFAGVCVSQPLRSDKDPPLSPLCLTRAVPAAQLCGDEQTAPSLLLCMNNNVALALLGCFFVTQKSENPR